MKNNIFIPQRINVGFQKRDDTYTKKLAYVIYYDQKNILRKEASWNSWRDKKIEPIEYENIPISGFVLNKKVGGYSSGWNHRQTYTRIYDPRDFEFEITIPNLLYILENTNSIKGKGLEGEFVYGWDGKDLILIPTSSPDYEQLTKFNDVVYNNNFIKAKDLIVGATYMHKNNQTYVYMGKFDCYDYQYRTLENGEYKWYNSYKNIPTETKTRTDSYWRYSRTYEERIDHKHLQNNCGKQFFFWTKSKDYRGNEYDDFVHMKSIAQIFISTIDENCVDNYAELFEKMEHDKYYSPIDDTKDKIIPYEFDEFKNIILDKVEYYKKYNWCNFPNFYNKYLNFFSIEIDKESNKFSIIDESRNEDGFRHKKQAISSNLTTEELFNQLQPVHLDKYLENNKFYERKY